MEELGARPGSLVGIDVVPQRIDEARRLHPEYDLRVGDASRLEFEDASSDLVLFSSVLDEEKARRIASEIVRVLRPGGAVLWYELRVGNPWNPDVRGLPVRAVRDLFPGLEVRLRRITLVPQVARRLAG